MRIFQDAYAAVQELLDSTVGVSQDLEIVIAECIHLPNAWVFAYNTRKYLEGNDLMASMVGNGQVVVLAV